jgi:hypothetical protein
MIAGFVAALLEQDPIARREHESAALLPGVTLNQRLAMAAGKRAEHVFDEAWSQDHGSDAAQHAGFFVGLESRVGQKLKVDFLFFPELGGLARRTVANHDQIGASSSDFFFDVTQLRNLFATEHSAVVSDENQDRRFGFPEIA